MTDLFDVRKEIVLVTGASQGLGRQFARVLSAHGAAVVLAARQAAKLKALEDEIRSNGGRAVAVQMDVTDLASISKAIDGAESALGPISVLINNAGIAVEKPAVDQSEADWDAVINANLKGAYFAATEMARRMIGRKQAGNIVNIASVLGTGVTKFLSPLIKRIPQRRLGAESDLDGAIMLLASNASRYMTGSVVTVDGGFLLN
ncbi:MAG: SDR family NAD(P)-dependent oxidoreductase [Alphaproteobacteria bacterium]|nr:MAG: SDR family NAD(P)-dependent oxidoreductase [Alphaproteobacteria bacterium]